MISPDVGPANIIVVHRRERRSKCSVEALRGAPGLDFHWFPLSTPVDSTGRVLLAVDGPPLTEADRDLGFVFLDATWRHLEKMRGAFFDFPVRSISGWRTAYPRVSKHFPDPSGGLATVEALFAALHIVGRPRWDLLDHYHWKDLFLTLNEQHLAKRRVPGETLD